MIHIDPHDLYALVCVALAVPLAWGHGYRIGRRNRQAEAEWRDYDEPPHEDEPNPNRPFDWTHDT